MLFVYKTCTLARWTFNITFWLSISITGPSNPKNLTFPPPKRNLHGGAIGNGHPYCLQILPWKHTSWPLECTKTMLFLYKTCTLARWTVKTTFWVSRSLIGVSNPKNITFPPPKRNLHGGTSVTGHPHWHQNLHGNAHFGNSNAQKQSFSYINRALWPDEPSRPPSGCPDL